MLTRKVKRSQNSVLSLLAAAEGDKVMRISPKWSLTVLTFLAGLKVFLFTAAHPFFAATDEQSHLDNIYRYAHGNIPKRLVTMEEGSARQIVFFRSAEVFAPPPPDAPLWYTTPFWADNLATGYPAFHHNLEILTHTPNIESVQPPPYYVLAAAWYRLGWALGLRGGWLLYWLRFLNVPLFALLIPSVYGLAVSCYGRETWIPMGAAIFAGGIPQDVFYSLNNDCLMPLVSGLALWAVVCLTRASKPSWGAYVGTGLLVGLALLSKLSNLPLLLPLIILMTASARSQGQSNRNILALGAFSILSLLPLGLWMLWNHHNTGDWTNSADKAAFLTWTRKSFGEIWNHPVFHGQGLGKFYWLTVANFWSGEGMWHKGRISPVLLDGVYVLLTTGLSITVLVAGVKRKSDDGGLYDLAFLSYFGLSVASLLVLSLLWDFGRCFNPSRAEPFFVSGRLILGCLLPMVLVCLRGAELVFQRLRTELRNVVFGALIAAILVAQTVPRIEQFSSPFNWYHLKMPGDPTIMNQPF